MILDFPASGSEKEVSVAYKPPVYGLPQSSLNELRCSIRQHGSTVSIHLKVARRVLPLAPQDTDSYFTAIAIHSHSPGLIRIKIYNF